MNTTDVWKNTDSDDGIIELTDIVCEPPSDGDLSDNGVSNTEYDTVETGASDPEPKIGNPTGELAEERKHADSPSLEAHEEDHAVLSSLDPSADECKDFDTDPDAESAAVLPPDECLCEDDYGFDETPSPEGASQESQNQNMLDQDSLTQDAQSEEKSSEKQPAEKFPDVKKDPTDNASGCDDVLPKVCPDAGTDTPNTDKLQPCRAAFESLQESLAARLDELTERLDRIEASQARASLLSVEDAGEDVADGNAKADLSLNLEYLEIRMNAAEERIASLAADISRLYDAPPRQDIDLGTLVEQLRPAMEKSAALSAAAALREELAKLIQQR